MEPSVETRAALEAVPARMAEAWERGDAAGFTADFAPHARLIEFEGTILTGRDTIAEAQAPLFASVLKGSRLVEGTTFFAEILTPGVAVVHHRASVLMAGESEPLPTRQSMQLYVLHWIDERWQVVVLQNARVLSFENAGRLDALV